MSCMSWALPIKSELFEYLCGRLWTGIHFCDPIEPLGMHCGEHKRLGGLSVSSEPIGLLPPEKGGSFSGGNVAEIIPMEQREKCLLSRGENHFKPF